MAAPSTIVVGQTPATTAQFTLAPGVFQYVESILVEVDNTGGGDARPTLRVATPGGVVMATKRQGEAVPAGDTGTATWALRLTDEVDLATVGNDVTRSGLTMRVGEAAGANQVITMPTRAADKLSANKYIPHVLTWTLGAGSKIKLEARNVNARPYQVSFLQGFVQRIDVIASETVVGNSVTLAAGGFTNMQWAHDSGSALLAYADPKQPTAVVAGLYAVQAQMIWFPV